MDSLEISTLRPQHIDKMLAEVNESSKREFFRALKKFLSDELPTNSAELDIISGKSRELTRAGIWSKYDFYEFLKSTDTISEIRLAEFASEMPKDTFQRAAVRVFAKIPNLAEAVVPVESKLITEASVEQKVIVKRIRQAKRRRTGAHEKRAARRLVSKNIQRNKETTAH